MSIRLSFLYFFLGTVVFAQKPMSQDKAYMGNDSIVILGDDYILKSSVETPNDFKAYYPHVPDSISIKSLSLLFKGKDYIFVNSRDNAVYGLKNDSLILWISPEATPSIGATYLVRNDTIFRYGGKRGLMNIDYWSFLNEAQKSWGPYPTFKSDYTPNGTFNNCYVSAGEQIIFVRGARVNRRNLSDEYLDDHIVRYDWNLKKWRELGHVRADYKNFSKSIAMGDELLFYNDKSMFHVNPFTNKNTLYYRNLTHQYLHKNDQLDALYSKGIFYVFIDNPDGIIIRKIPKNDFLKGVESVDAFYDPPANPYPYEYVLIIILFIAAVYRPIRSLLIKDKIQLDKRGFKYSGVLHPMASNEVEVIKLLLSRDFLTTQDLMLLLENPNISYSQNMKIKNQLIENLNVVLKTILNISTPVIKEVKDKNDHRVTLYTIDPTFFKH